MSSSSSLGFFTKLGCVLVLAAPACVIRLAERNAPIPNGGVTGEAANCAAVTPEPRGGPGPGPAYNYSGRFIFLEQKDNNGQPFARFDWSGNYISARFTGSEVSFTVLDHQQDILFDQILDGVVVSGEYPAGRRVYTELLDGRSKYGIARNLDPNVPHEIILHRNSEAQKGRITFAGFDFGPGGKLLPPTKRARRIEIIGDSITCGYGNMGANATCPFDVVVPPLTPKAPSPDGKPPIEIKLPVTENNYLAYGSLAGRQLDADVTTLCWSGKGVALNYKERFDDKGLADIDGRVTVPDLYTRPYASLNVGPFVGPKYDTPPAVPQDLRQASETDLANEKALAGATPILEWDFTKEEQPQVVLIHLGTNDYARDQITNASGNIQLDPKTQFPGDNIPDGTILNAPEKANFVAATRKLITDVRARRPNAHIFISVPPMLTNQFPFEGARDDLRGTYLDIVNGINSQGDKKVYVVEFVEQGVRYGLGCDYHPNLDVHRIMADQLVGAIKSKTCWN